MFSWGFTLRVRVDWSSRFLRLLLKSDGHTHPYFILRNFINCIKAKYRQVTTPAPIEKPTKLIFTNMVREEVVVALITATTITALHFSLRCLLILIELIFERESIVNILSHFKINFIDKLYLPHWTYKNVHIFFHQTWQCN